MQSLEGTFALITGGATELGSQIIRELALRDAHLIAVDSSEEKVDDAIANLGLENPDEIFTGALEGNDVGAWWDLANLIAAYFHTLNLFVHIAETEDSGGARALGVDALRGAQGANAESFLTAMARFEKNLTAAAEEDDQGACVVVVTDGSRSDASGALASATHATSAALSAALSREYRAAGLNIRIHAYQRAAGEPAAAAAAGVVELLNK